MPLTDAAKQVGLDAVAGVALFVSIHSADPGATGLNEIGTRQSVTWNAAVGGNLDSSNAPAFAVTAGQTVHSVGLWSAATAGTFYGYKPLPTAETFGNDGTFTVNDLDINWNDAA